MIKLIDNILNRITTYRLVLYYLVFLVVAAVALSSFGLLPFQPLDLRVSVSISGASPLLPRKARAGCGLA